MSLSRKHYTALAEIVGEVEAGRILPGDLRDTLHNELLQHERNYDQEQFNHHAHIQRAEVAPIKVDELQVGDSILYGGGVLPIVSLQPRGARSMVATLGGGHLHELARGEWT